MLQTVGARKLAPSKLVSRLVGIEEASGVLEGMEDFAGRGAAELIDAAAGTLPRSERPFQRCHVRTCDSERSPT
jgi:hypothetical protein